MQVRTDFPRLALFYALFSLFINNVFFSIRDSYAILCLKCPNLVASFVSQPLVYDTTYNPKKRFDIFKDEPNKECHNNMFLSLGHIENRRLKKGLPLQQMLKIFILRGLIKFQIQIALSGIRHKNIITRATVNSKIAFFHFYSQLEHFPSFHTLMLWI